MTTEFEENLKKLKEFQQEIDDMHFVEGFFVLENDKLRPMKRKEFERISDAKLPDYWDLKSAGFGHDLFDCLRYKETFPTYYNCLMDSLSRVTYRPKIEEQKKFYDNDDDFEDRISSRFEKKRVY